MFTPPAASKKKRQLHLEQPHFRKAYISYLLDSRIPKDGLADTLNIDIVQDGLPRPRPSTVLYGSQPVGTVIGMAQFSKHIAGLVKPERWDISMQVVSGVGKIHIRKDGAAWTEIGGSYDDEAWTDFCQASGRVYVSNGVDAMSYYDTAAGTITTYTAISSPGAPSLTPTGLTGTTTTYYYRITAENDSGETARSNATSQQVSLGRDFWDPATQYISVSWSAVTGAIRYNIYVGDVSGQEYYIASVNGTTYRDDGTATINPIRRAPQGNSTAGPILTYMINKASQLFGVGDKDNPSYLWYSGQGEDAGDWSPFNGGGYVAIDYGGSTIPVGVLNFRDGRGNPVVTVFSKGAAGGGKVSHVSFNTQSLGDTIIIYPEIYEATGQSGTYSARGMVEANNSIHYPTGTSFKSTGTKANVVNILATDSISQAIDPDVRRLNLDAMDQCVGVEFENRIYWAVPKGTDENNEIWVYDISRNGLWILPWTIPAKHIWKAEDNMGRARLLVLVDNQVLEVTRSVAHTDNGVPFRARCASGGLIWSETAMSLAAVQEQRFKFIQPKGAINVNSYGIGEDGPTGSLANQTYQQITSNTAWNLYGYNLHAYNTSEVPQLTSQSISVVTLEIDETLNQSEWEIISDTAGTDWSLAGVLTTGVIIDGAYYES